MRRCIAIAAVVAGALLPSAALAANPGFDAANRCGMYHGMFGLPAHGTLFPGVRDLAASGYYKGGFVGDNASDPICHADSEG